MDALSVLLLLCYAACSVGVAVSGITIYTTAPPTVDLGYEIYTGYYNSTADLNVFKGCGFLQDSALACRSEYTRKWLTAKKL